MPRLARRMPKAPTRFVRCSRFARPPPQFRDTLAIVRMHGVNPAAAAMLFPTLASKFFPRMLRRHIMSGGVCSPGNVSHDRDQCPESFVAVAPALLRFSAVSDVHD